MLVKDVRRTCSGGRHNSVGPLRGWGPAFGRKEGHGLGVGGQVIKGNPQVGVPAKPTRQDSRWGGRRDRAGSVSKVMRCGGQGLVRLTRDSCGNWTEQEEAPIAPLHPARAQEHSARGTGDSRPGAGTLVRHSTVRPDFRGGSREEP